MPPLVVRGYGDLRAEVTAVTSGAEHPGEAGRPGRVRLDELARRRGVRPVESVAEMAQDGVFAATASWRSSSPTSRPSATRTSPSVSYVALDTDVSSRIIRGRLEGGLAG
jgi:hypothetical protein